MVGGLVFLKGGKSAAQVLALNLWRAVGGGWAFWGGFSRTQI